MIFRILAPVLLVGAFLAAIPAEADQTFNSPAVNGASVDNCASWATDCGWGGAHQFCRMQGYGAARSFLLFNPGRTWVIGSQKYCDGGSCVGFSQVVCMGDTTPSAGDRLFNAPQMNGAVVDNCATWANDCGWGGAHQFCRMQGYAAARSFLLYNPGRTWVAGSQKYCDGGSCVGFAQVVCIAGIAPPPPPPPSANVLSGHWYGFSNDYYFQQSGNSFSWNAPGLKETAQGTIDGAALTVTWTNTSGQGSTTGTITAFDGFGRATRIHWNNGIDFDRKD